MPEIDVSERYPDLQPVERAPTLFSILGCGLNFSGPHQADPEVASFLADHCLALLGIPVLRLGSYRFALGEDEQQYLLGREPLRAGAQWWNYAAVSLLVLACAALWWQNHTNSPEHLARRQLAQARAAAEEGRLQDAVAAYRRVLVGGTTQAEPAAAALEHLLSGPLQSAAPAEAQATLALFVDMARLEELPQGRLDVVGEGIRAAEAVAGDEPRTAAAMLDSLVPLAPDSDELRAARLALWQRLVDSQPADPQVVSRLALIHEEQGEFDECETLLEPLRDELGESEGARILGQIDARAGRIEAGRKLLAPYVEQRLAALHAATEEYQRLIERHQQRAIDHVNDGGMPSDLQRRIRTADEAEQFRLLNEYVRQQLERDPQVSQAQLEIMDASAVVPTALDLGILLLQWGRQLPDPDARRQAFEQAENVFLGVRGFAGETIEYRLSLGEVYYWLGRPEEGRQLFDAVLEQSGREPQLLLQAASKLRTLGETAESRALAEEAFTSADTVMERNTAAGLRAICSTDLDDSIEWYRRVENPDLGVKAMLEGRLAERAMRDGETEQAIAHVRTAIRLYEQRSDSVGALNNSSLLYGTLFELTGDPSALKRRSELMQRAVQLEPSDAIVVSNAADASLAAALAAVIGDRIDLAAVKISPALDLLGYLYENTAEYEALVEQLRRQPQAKQAAEQYERALVLAPRSLTVYNSSSAYYGFVRDEQALERMLARLETTRPDNADQLDALRRYASGEQDEKLLASSASQIASLRKALAELEARPRDATYALAAGKLGGALLLANEVGEPADLDETLELAESAHRAQPSVATRHFLVQVLLFRVSERLAERDREYRQTLAAGRRQAGPVNLLALELLRDAAFQTLVAGDAEFQRAAGLIWEAFHAVPQLLGAWEWAVLQAADAAQAEQVRAHVLRNQFRALQRELSQRASPDGVLQYQLQDYLDARLNDDKPRAAELLEAIQRNLHSEQPQAL